MAETPPASPKAADLRALTLKTTEAAHLYAIKDYAAAADLYSEATELQSQLYGEMAPENADLLYAYGRCLYHVAVGNNDVLGGGVAGEGGGVAGEGEGGKNKRKRKAPNVEGLGAHRVAEEAEAVEQEQLARGVGGKTDGSIITQQGQEKKEESKPYFQITGDAEEWDDSDLDDRGGESDAAEGEDGEEDGVGDDFATAYEILDLARLLLSQRIEALAENAAGTGQGKSKKKDTIEMSQAKERLADIHDLQAEISMENGRFADAITDARASLVLKEELFSKESNLVAEAHFKLSLALEFASVTRVKSADGAPHVGDEVQVDEGEAQVDEAMREEAAMHMEAAIESSKRRVDSETKSLGSLEEEIRLKTEKSIADVKGMIQEMEERLQDLRNPAVSMNGVGTSAGSKSVGGILGSLLGESPAAQKARIEEATKEANDLTGLVRHSKKPENQVGNSSTAMQSTRNGPLSKRKAESERIDKVDGRKKAKLVVVDAETKEV